MSPVRTTASTPELQSGDGGSTPSLGTSKGLDEKLRTIKSIPFSQKENSTAIFYTHT